MIQMSPNISLEHLSFVTEAFHTERCEKLTPMEMEEMMKNNT